MKTKAKIARTVNVTEGSDNVFADLGVPDSGQELMKARLTLSINHIIKARGLTQTEAGDVLGIPQPQVSILIRNRGGTFSVGRLIEFLTILGQDVEITIRPTRNARGAGGVVFA
jgi:predicted XRE-type DNA-binding protein